MLPQVVSTLVKTIGDPEINKYEGCSYSKQMGFTSESFVDGPECTLDSALFTTKLILSVL